MTPTIKGLAVRSASGRVQASPEFAMHCCANGTWMRRG